MSLGLCPSDSIHSLRLTFRRHATSVLTLRTDLTHTQTNLSSDSHDTCYGLGSDLGTFIYWFGERLLDGWVEILIRIRLRAIRRALNHRGDAPTVDIIKARYIRDACEDLLELCRRKAIRLILILLRPLDAWSLVLLGSNFVDVLSAYRPDICNDFIMAQCFGEIMQIESLLSSSPCCCETCLQTLRQEVPHVRHCRTPCDQSSRHDKNTVPVLPKLIYNKIRSKLHLTKHDK